MVSLNEQFGENQFGEYTSEVVALTEKVFSANGWLQKRLRMENRPQQTRMAEAVAGTFVEGNSLLFEAGTGVGKSLAYLIPGLIFSKIAKKKFVVSTNTIPLQEQILKKDLAICRELFSSVPELADFVDFKVVLMIGRANYLCGTRLAEALRRHDGIFDGTDASDEARELMMIRDWWAEEGCSGVRESLPQEVSDDVWETVNGDSRACSRKNCTPKTCARRRAQAALESANLVIVNHSLLFSMIGAGAAPKEETPGVLYANDFVVLDEAHLVPDIATEYFGVDANSYGLQRLLSRIFKAGRKGGVLFPHGSRELLKSMVTEAKDAAEVFFNDIRFRFLAKAQTVRFREPNWAQNVCEIPLGNLERKLKAFAQVEERASAKDEINDFADQLQLFRISIRECLELKRAPKYVYWAEVNGVKRRTILLAGAPIDVAPQLADALFGRGTSAVLSSATLSNSKKDMERFRRRCGADIGENDVRSQREDSPFDYANAVEIFVATDCPEPEKQNALLDVDYNGEIATHCIRMMPNGGTLILCTSFDFCAKLATAIRSRLGDEREVFVQGEGLPRQEMTRRFVAGGNAVLIGNHSYWMGIDVPGNALSQVIVPRLPFANPRDPLVEARTEWIKEQGGNPFYEMSVPDAVLQFRQGIGRLIRKATDRGRLILTDSRLVKKTYGKQFLAALPHQKYIRFERDLMRETIREFK